MSDDEIAKLNLTDKVYYIDSVMNHKDDKNTFCYHHFLEEPCVYKQEFGHFDFFTQNDLGYKSEDMLENELDVFRNNKFLSTLLVTLRPETKLCIACDLTLSSEYIKTKEVKIWKSTKVDIHKRPTIFLIQSN